MAELKWRKNITFSKWQISEDSNAKINNLNGCFENKFGAICQVFKTGTTWSFLQQKKHINVIERLAAKFARLTLSRSKSVREIDLKQTILQLSLVF